MLKQTQASNNAAVLMNCLSKPLPIGYERTCDCPPGHINCLTAKEWIKHQLGVWQFYYEARDIRDKSVHPVTFPIALGEHLVICNGNAVQ